MTKNTSLNERAKTRYNMFHTRIRYFDAVLIQ